MKKILTLICISILLSSCSNKEIEYEEGQSIFDNDDNIIIIGSWGTSNESFWISDWGTKSQDNPINL